MNPRWQAALAWALVGELVELDEMGSPDPQAVVRTLADRGWPAGLIREHARAVIAEAGVWPHPIPEDLRSGCGAAQLAAGITAARTMLDLVTMDKRPPSARTRLNADEERLLAEVPPHHGH